MGGVTQKACFSLYFGKFSVKILKSMVMYGNNVAKYKTIPKITCPSYFLMKCGIFDDFSVKGGHPKSLFFTILSKFYKKKIYHHLPK